MKYPSHPPRAFTLIELLTVIAIIGILAGLVIGSIGAARKKAHQVRCISNLRQIGIAILAYTDEHKGILPGPTYVGISASYKNNSTAIYQLAAQLGPYMSYPDATTLQSGVTVTVPQLHCPSRPLNLTAEDPDEPATFIAQCNMKPLSNEGRPFGNAPVGSTPERKPIPFTELEAHGGASQVWSLMEVDQQVTWSSVSDTWKPKLPLSPAHGGRRTTLYFDARVALLNKLPPKI
ncbi:prepilin-type N-terminal cleavage/methylation domain-containing protein [Opitutaceae bacterium TAV4]|nr:prepilin-type N-terminal cleavage/methylation domain-containing protein [Opitutaceae bacterium TAV4]RRJ99522.1 prepilin-type N-terminal cleavage/methylation domain-containing protein [Opitutaceae bacterium TAV3]